MTPGIVTRIGPFCGLGYLQPVSFGSLTLRARCTVQVQAEGSHVLKLGAADFKTYGDFFALGTKVGFDVAAATPA